MDEKVKSSIKNFVKMIIKFVITLVILYVSVLFAFYLFLIGSSWKIAMPLIVCSSIIAPWGSLIPLYAKNKLKALKYWGIYTSLFVIAVTINIAIIKHDEKITINTSPNINCEEYLPFDENSKIVKLEKEASLKLKDKLPIIDGAAAVFPVYSAFINATYPNTVKFRDGIFEYNNTVEGYKLLAEKKTDIFFGAYPSEEQREYAKTQGTEFEYTEIGTESFVFFVHKDNSIESLSTEQIQKIYSGEITNWKDVGGKDEEIVAFQRNEGSGSQSMLIRFMGDKKIMKPPTEQVNDLMSGIIEQVSNYKNKTNSIGFSFRYYLEGIIKNPDIKMVSIDGIKPTVSNIKNGKYPITTPLYAVTYKDNPNENVHKLINWVLSEEGQEILEKTGYVGISK